MRKDKYQVSVLKVRNGYLTHLSGGNIDDEPLLVSKTLAEAARLVCEYIKEDARPKESDPDYYKELIEIIRDNNHTHEISIYTTKSTTIVEGYFLSDGKWMTMGNVECDTGAESNDVVRTMIKKPFHQCAVQESRI